MKNLLFLVLSLCSTWVNAVSVPNSTAGPLYKNPKASVDARIADLLPRMTIEDKMAQLMQGGMDNWIDTTTNAFNFSGLVENMATMAGQVSSFGIFVTYYP